MCAAERMPGLGEGGEAPAREMVWGRWGPPSRSHLHCPDPCHFPAALPMGPCPGHSPLTALHTDPAHAHGSSPSTMWVSSPSPLLGPCTPDAPLPPVSGRQLQLCSLLSEQVDSDAQNHKPWVGMSFFLSLLQACSACPSPLASPSPPPPHPTPPVSSFVLHILPNFQVMGF